MNELYLKYKNQGIFTKDEIAKDFPHLSSNAINKKIYKAKKSKLIKGIGRRAIYFIVEPEQNYKTAEPDKFKVASKLSEDVVICYVSALGVLGKSHAILNTIYFSSSKRIRDLNLNNTYYKFVQLPNSVMSQIILPLNSRIKIPA